MEAEVVLLRDARGGFGDPEMEAVLELEAAARILDLEGWIVERLRHPEYEATNHVLLRKNNGQAITVPVLHVEHSTERGVSCGPLTLAADEFAGHLRAEAMQVSWQHAMFDLPFGGGTSAILCDPRNLSEQELRRLMGEFIAVGPQRECVLYQATGMNACIAGWTHAGGRSYVCGGPVAVGGVSPSEISAVLLFHLVNEWCSRTGEEIAGKSVAVQGFSGAGVHVAAMLDKAGAQITAVSDISGGIYDPQGLNLNALRAHVDREGVLLGYADAAGISNAQVVEAPCDVLVLAAEAGQISGTNANQVKARVVVECVSGAVSEDAERILARREVEVIPEMIAGGGRALAAYIEYSHRSEVRWSSRRCEVFVRRAVKRVLSELGAAKAKWGVSMRDAAVALGVERVADVIRAKGF